MHSLSDFLVGFLDTLTGHLALTVCLLAVTDERAVWRRLKKLPPLLLSPLISVLLAAGLHTVPALEKSLYFINSFAILIMCTLWVQWAWRFGFWQSFAATCMAGIFQVADATLSMMVPIPFAATIGLHLGISAAASLLLYKLQFGRWFRLLLDNKSSPWRIALLLFALEAAMEMFLQLAFGIQPRLLTFYYLLVLAMVILMAVLIVHLAQRFDTARKMQAQQDIITQQRLYEQDLEIIRREVRTFRHDYKNLLTGLSQQAGAGELDQLCATLSELNAGFDQRFGEKIQASTQIGNLQIPQMRSLLLSKLTAMREKGVECRLEILYPISDINMDIWDFVRCLGILIDNAVEAVEGRDHPWVEIILLAQEGQVNLRVSNPWNGVANPARFWEEGWSTKGINRGLGLSSYVRILARYANVSRCTSWTNGVFLQELTVGGAS